MKIVICGAGEIGYALCQELERDHDVYVIDHDPEALARFDRFEILATTGSAVDPDVLRRAGVEDAAYFIACTGSDEINLIASITAKQISRARTICFIQSESYAERFGAGSLRSIFAIDELVWPEQLLADEIERVVLVPDALDVETFAHGRAAMIEYSVRGTTIPTGKPLKDIRLPADTLIAAIVRDDQVIIPTGTTAIAETDKVVFMGTGEGIRGVQRRFARRREAVSDAVIIGGGTVGFMIAKRLLEEHDMHVRVVEKDPERCGFLAAHLPRAIVIEGDGTDPDLLENERIVETDCLISVTTNDEKNLITSLIAKKRGVPKTVTRVTKGQNVRIFREAGIDVPMNSRAAAVRQVVHGLRHKGLNLLAIVEEGKAEVLEISVPGSFKPRPVATLGFPQGAIAGAIDRAGATIIPHGATEVRPGDHILVFCTAGLEEQIRSLLS